MKQRRCFPSVRLCVASPPLTAARNWAFSEYGQPEPECSGLVRLRDLDLRAAGARLSPGERQCEFGATQRNGVTARLLVPGFRLLFWRGKLKLLSCPVWVPSEPRSRTQRDAAGQQRRNPRHQPKHRKCLQWRLPAERKLAVAARHCRGLRLESLAGHLPRCGDPRFTESGFCRVQPHST